MSTRHQLLQIIAMATVGLLLLMTSVMDTVDARGPPRVIESNYQKRHLVREGEHIFRLVCPVDSTPPPLIAWIKDEDTIHLGWERYKISGEKLVIKDLEVTDSGVFICRATNGFGTVDVRYLVYVYADSNNTVLPSDDFDEDIFDTIPGNEAPPSFLDTEEMKSSLSPSTGSTLELSCKLTGRPVPVISWYKNGVRMSTEKQNRVTIIDNIRGVSVLHLSEVLENDSGRYTCVARNSVGAVNFTFTVNVDDSAGHKAGFIAHYPKNVTVAYGETAELHCFVHSANTPRIQWLRQIEPTMDMRNNTAGVVTILNRPYLVLESDQTIARQDGTYFNKLVIRGTTEQDAGVYICTKTDNQGFGYRSAHLTVLTGPRGLLDSDSIALSLDSPFLPIILAIVLVGCAVIVAIVVFVLYRRRAHHRENIEAPHATLPRPAASSSSVAGSTVGYPGRSPDKRLDHHYAALHMSSGSGTPKSVAHDRLGRDIVAARGGCIRDNNFSDQSSMMSDAASPFHQQYSQQQQQQHQQQQQSLLYQRQNHHLLQQQQQQYYPPNKQLLHHHDPNQANNGTRPCDIAYC